LGCIQHKDEARIPDARLGFVERDGRKCPRRGSPLEFNNVSVKLLTVMEPPAGGLRYIFARCVHLRGNAIHVGKILSQDLGPNFSVANFQKIKVLQGCSNHFCRFNP
jgi:hypothetical protein